jgi:hypothetical protein
MKSKIILLISIFSCFWIFHFAFQQKTIYSHSLGKISSNWENKDGNRILAQTPYQKINNQSLIHWDAAHYQSIKDNGYDISKAGGDYIFAFFPLFPMIWKLSLLSPTGIVFLNFLFFALSIMILLELFSPFVKKNVHLLLAFSLPSLAIFFIPYSEATSFLMLSIAVYGFMKHKQWIFVTGLILASLTRPTYTFLFLSFVGTEIFFLLGHRNLKQLLTNSFKYTFPMFIGTLLVSMFQLTQGSQRIFKFIEVQKYWENILSIPHHLRDWSHEGFAINIGVIFILFIPFVWLLIFNGINLFKNGRNNENHTIDRKYYLTILSLFYLVGSTLFILLFRGGSLNCLFRFTLCTPFTFILLFGAHEYIKNVPRKYQLFSIAILANSALLVLGLADYSAGWNFSDFGFLLLFFTILLWILQNLSESKFYKIAVVSNLLLNIIWTTYLFNTYLADGWIFA